MRAVCQRVRWARVRVGERLVSEIGMGWAVLLGVARDDDEPAARALAERIAEVQAFDDGSGRMALSAREVGAEFLIVSQITLNAEFSAAGRPSFTSAAPRELATHLIEVFVGRLIELDFAVATGEFGAMMTLELCNEGPVTVVLSSEN